jgi:hypothetical protein
MSEISAPTSFCPQCYCVNGHHTWCSNYVPAIPQPEYGRYTFTPVPLTADEIRKILREELERAKGTP